MSSLIIILAVTLKLVEFPQASMQISIGQNRKRGRPNKTKKALVRQNENNSLSPRSSQTDSGTLKSDNSSLLVDRILMLINVFVIKISMIQLMMQILIYLVK